MAVWAGEGILFAALLIGASYCDIRTRKVPDIYSILLAATALLIPDFPKFWGILCGCPFLLAALTVGVIGGADIKIMGAAGMVLGLKQGMFAMIIGLAGMLAYHLIRKIFFHGTGKAEQAYPLIPFLTAGMVLAYLTLIPTQ